MKKNITPTSNAIWFIADKDYCYNFSSMRIFKVQKENITKWYKSEKSIWIGGPCLGRWDD